MKTEFFVFNYNSILQIAQRLGMTDCRVEYDGSRSYNVHVIASRDDRPNKKEFANAVCGLADQDSTLLVTVHKPKNHDAASPIPGEPLFDFAGKEVIRCIMHGNGVSLRRMLHAAPALREYHNAQYGGSLMRVALCTLTNRFSQIQQSDTPILSMIEVSKLVYSNTSLLKHPQEQYHPFAWLLISLPLSFSGGALGYDPNRTQQDIGKRARTELAKLVHAIALNENNRRQAPINFGDVIENALALQERVEKPYVTTPQEDRREAVLGFLSVFESYPELAQIKELNTEIQRVRASINPGAFPAISRYGRTVPSPLISPLPGSQ